MRTLSVAVCGLAVIEESLEPVLCVCLSPGYSICIICELRRWRMESSHCFCIDDVIRFCLFPAQKKTEKKRKLDLSFWHIYQQFTER